MTRMPIKINKVNDDTFLSLDDGLRYPWTFAIDDVNESGLVNRFYRMQGMMHPKEKEADNRMKVSGVWYRLASVSKYDARGKWITTYNPDQFQTEAQRQAEPMRTLKAQYVQQLLQCR